jgi:hypothetical protein
MIVKIHKSGSSLKDGALYLTHDPKARTTERVAWTHTQNLANDHIPSAVDEMLWTYRNADLLKQEAGVKAGGRPTRKPVKHLSMNWHVDDNPSQEHMIQSGKDLLKRLGWSEHQAIFVAHSDKDHKHMHILVNAVHPETGRSLKSGWEHNRAQKWAADYEHANGVIRCPERLRSHEREVSMPRNMWMAFRNNELEFEKSEKQFRREFAKQYSISDQWEVFKSIQKAERQQFFADGKAEFKALRNRVYNEVREEFRPRWAAYYSEKKHSTAADKDRLAQMKAEITAEQSETLSSKRDLACEVLLVARKAERLELKLKQQAQRVEFKERVATGIDNADYFHDMVEQQANKQNMKDAFRQAASETTSRVGIPPKAREERGQPKSRDEETRMSHSRDGVGTVRRRVTASVGSFLDALFFELTNLGSPRPQMEQAREDRDPLDVRAEDETKRMLQEHQQRYDEEWRERSKRSYGE